MKHHLLTQQQLGQRIGVSKGYISLMISGKEPITKKVLAGLQQSFPNLNLSWLLQGRGDMFFEEKEVVPPPEPGVLVGVMEPKPPVYEKGANGGGGVLESAMKRLSVLEGKVAELEDENETLRARLDDQQRLLLKMRERVAELEEGGG